jgi:hypothetical protein
LLSKAVFQFFSREITQLTQGCHSFRVKGLVLWLSLPPSKLLQEFKLFFELGFQEHSFFKSFEVVALLRFALRMLLPELVLVVAWDLLHCQLANGC